MYRNTQFGTVIVAFLGVGILLPLSIGLRAGFNPVLGVVIAMLASALILFHSLTVELTPGRLIVRFGPGLIRKRFAIDQIRDVRIVRNKWYYGWGIRWTPHGWLYSVSGLDAIQIKLENGRQYRVGTNRPEELFRTLEQVIRMSALPSRK
jgi:hypothetical protein